MDVAQVVVRDLRVRHLGVETMGRKTSYVVSKMTRNTSTATPSARRSGSIQQAAQGFSPHRALGNSSLALAPLRSGSGYIPAELSPGTQSLWPDPKRVAWNQALDLPRLRPSARSPF